MQPERPRLPLRQIEVLRAVMVTGSIAGAARLLNVSAPGLSRLMKYTEDSAGVRLFDRSKGRLAPTAEANTIFNLLDMVYGRVEDLQEAISAMQRGSGQELDLASVPSIGNIMVPRAVARLREKFPELDLNIDIIKIEEAIDYLLLGRGELMVLSSGFEHSVINVEPLASGRLVCVVPENSELAGMRSISVQEMARHPLIGINPNDPYGSIMTRVFRENGIEPKVAIMVRFGSIVCRMVAEGLGIAVLDEFTVAYGNIPGIALLEIEADTPFETFIAHRKDRALSAHAEEFVSLLRHDMRQTAAAGYAGKEINT